MIKKIISGGQTGADRAALDLAIKLHIHHGGWVPKGRKAEDGPLPSRYLVTEMLSDDYRDRTRQNIQDSDGTLIISYGNLTGGSNLTQSYAKVLGKPNCYIDLLKTESFEASIIIQSFILENYIEVLNVAGPRLSHFPDIYDDVTAILEATLYLLFLDSTAETMIKELVPENAVESVNLPEDCETAAALICDDLSLKAKTFIARLDHRNMAELYFGFLDYLRCRLGFNSENQMLLDHCRAIKKERKATIEDAVMMVLEKVKSTLETKHLLRVVK